MTQAKAVDTPGLRRARLSVWAAVHAWKLAGLTAIVTFVGVFIAVSLSLVLRPTRSYVFPLLSDVDKHQPEGAILRVAFVAATALLFATTSASFLHCHSVRFFRDAAEAHAHASLDNIATISPVDVAYRVDSPHRNHVHDLSEITPVQTKRRAPRLNTLQVLILVPMCTTIVFTFLQYSGLTVILANVSRRHLVKLGLYALCATWSLAMAFLVWYFLKLQNMPDRTPASQGDVIEDVEASYPDTAAFTASNAPVVDRFRAWAAWLIVILRPICLTGQVVCIIKIVGLWLALDTFSISNIRLVKIALLAALAFAEYTAAFFFAFFMTILAVDMRSKAIASDLLQS